MKKENKKPNNSDEEELGVKDFINLGVVLNN